MEKKMNVLHICPSFNNDIYTQLVERQMAYGDKLRVFYFRAKGTGAPNGDRDYVDAVHPYRNMDRASFYYKEQKILRSFFSIYQNEYDLIHAHTLFSSGYIAYRAHQKWGTPYIVSVRATDLMPFFKYRVYLRKLGIDILEKAQAIIFLSQMHVNELFEKYVPQSKRDALMKKTFVIPNGIDRFWFENEGPIKQKQPGKDVHVIFYGDIVFRKNIETTIKACRLLIKEGYRVKYTVIGEVLDKQYGPMIANNDFIDYHHFMPKEEIVNYLRQADIMVMPSRAETFGLTYAEAMTQGVPVIYTKGQGFDERFPEGTVGYHVKATDAEQIVEKIKLILSDISAISENCLHCTGDFNWDSVAERFQKIYEDIVSDHEIPQKKDHE